MAPQNFLVLPTPRLRAAAMVSLDVTTTSEAAPLQPFSIDGTLHTWFRITSWCSGVHDSVTDDGVTHEAGNLDNINPDIFRSELLSSSLDYEYTLFPPHGLRYNRPLPVYHHDARCLTSGCVERSALQSVLPRHRIGLGSNHNDNNIHNSALG